MGRVTPPRKIFGMHRLQADRAHRVHQEERVKIRQGLICRERVWLDEFGNELDKVDDHTFQVRPLSATLPPAPAPVIHGYPEPAAADANAVWSTVPVELQLVAKAPATKAGPGSRDEADLALALLLVGTLTLLVLLWFMAGYLLGRRLALLRSAPAQQPALPTPAVPVRDVEKAAP